MFIEFHFLLRELFSRIGEDAPVQYLEVEQSPFRELADVSSSAAIKVGSERGILPFQLAEQLVASLQDHEKALFHVDAAPSGHLNARVTPFFLNSFLRALETKEPLHQGSLVLEREGAVFEPRLEVDWKARSFLARRRDDNVFQELENRRGYDDILMLVAAAADPELDLEVYRSGMSGRENIPWLLSRFASDVDRLPRAEVGDFPFLFSLFRNPPLTTPCPVRAVLSLRGVYRIAAQRHRPDLLVKEIIDGVRGFYAFFNQPTYRLPQNPSAVELGVLGRSLRGMAESMLKNLVRD